MKTSGSLTTVLWIIFHCTEGFGYEIEDVVTLRASAGRNAYLPCGQEKVFLDGPGSYVAWMKENQFVYRYPNEETELTTDSYDYGRRDHCENMKGCVDKTSLLLKSLAIADAGVYSCRIHYMTLPSVDYVIGVQVVPSPQKPIFYSNDIETSTGYIGPIAVGSDLRFKCEVDYADNETILYWRRNGVILTEYSHPISLRPLIISYAKLNITREELDAHYECVAQNSDVSEPVSTTLTVKMFLPPVSVEVRMNDNSDFVAGEPRLVDCVIVGCVPPPTVTWHLGGRFLKAVTHKEHHEGNFTVSSLSVSPSLGEEGSALVCRAHNPYLRDQVYQHAVKINVGYKPACLRTREEIVGVVDMESETVTCTVEAAPEPSQFVWLFASTRKAYTNGKQVPGQKNSYSSTLNFRATTEDIGVLQCRAISSFGTQERPCLFRLVKGGVPETPTCLLLKTEVNSGRIECKKGFDGGRTQTIHLQIITEDGAVIVNRSNSLGHFHLQQLENSMNLTAVIFASSSRGRSNAQKIDLNNYNPAVKSSSTSKLPSNGYHLFLAVIETTIGLVLVLSITAAIGVIRKICLRRKKLRLTNEIANSPQELCPDIVPISRTDGSFHRQPEITRDDHPPPVNITYSPFDQCRITSELTLSRSPCPTPSCASETTLLSKPPHHTLETKNQPRYIPQRTFFV